MKGRGTETGGVRLDPHPTSSLCLVRYQMNDTDHTKKPQRKAISRLPAAPRHERCRAAVLEGIARLPPLPDDDAVHAAQREAVAACPRVRAEETRIAGLPVWLRGRDGTDRELQDRKRTARVEVVDGFLDVVGGGLERWPWRHGGQPWVLAADLYLALAGWAHPAIRSALVRLEAECLLEGADGNRAKNAKALRLTYAGVAAAAVMQKPPRDSALVLAELLALANDDPDLRARLDGYLGNDDTERGAA